MSRHAARTLFASGALLSAVVLASVQPAQAQNSGCSDIQPKLLERKAIVDRIQAAGKKQLDAKFACTTFGQLVTNGATLIKWLETNKEWCQIPSTFAEGIQSDHSRAAAMRGKACAVAAQQVQMEKRAKEQAAGGGGGGLLGGNGLEGQYRVPQGAL